jgi:hypothetical protein
MTTVYDGAAVVNPVHAELGHGIAGLYDWRRLWPRPGRTRRVDELSPPGQPRYEQLADRLRRRIIGGDWPDIASGPYFADLYSVSQTAVQKAFEILEREGMVRMEFGRRTTALPLKRWLVEVSLPPGDDGTAVAGAAAGHAAVQQIDSEPGTVRLTVASANWGGAAAVVASVAGTLPVTSVTVREA